MGSRFYSEGAIELCKQFEKIKNNPDCWQQFFENYLNSFTDDRRKKMLTELQTGIPFQEALISSASSQKEKEALVLISSHNRKLEDMQNQDRAKLEQLLNNKQDCFNNIDAEKTLRYFDIYGQLDRSFLNFLTSLPENFSDQIPILLSCEEAIEYIRKFNFPEDYLWISCLKGKLSAFIKDESAYSEYASVQYLDSDGFDTNTSETFSYRMRYKGLERLSKEHISKIRTNGSIVRSLDLKSWVFNPLESTDFEKDLHLARYLSKPRKQITKQEIYFFIHELEALVESTQKNKCTVFTDAKNNITDVNGMNDSDFEYSPVQSSQDKSQKQVRVNALHRIIKDAFECSTDKSARGVWTYINDNLEQYEEIIQEVDKWTSHDPKIHWLSHRDYECRMKRSTFENLISRLKASSS